WRHVEIIRRIDTHARCHGCDEQQNIHLLRIPRGRETAKIVRRAFDPESIRVGEKKRLLPEPRQDLSDPAALIEKRFALVRNQDFRDFTGCEMYFDLAGQIMYIDNCRIDTGCGEAVERMVDQRFARDRNQWLWHAIGQGSHPCAQSRGEDHGFGGQERGHWGAGYQLLTKGPQGEILDPFFRIFTIFATVSRTAQQKSLPMEPAGPPELRRSNKESRQMLLIPEFKLG